MEKTRAIQRGVNNCGECDEFPCHDILDAIERTVTFGRRIRESASDEELELLHKAFFLKRENLDRARRMRVAKNS